MLFKLHKNTNYTHMSIWEGLSGAPREAGKFSQQDKAGWLTVGPTAKPVLLVAFENEASTGDVGNA